ncbi:MAG: alpha/beta hydrolase [Alistipes sp.]|nr:alpha/beta hydrolase [Alistipes sp.]
MKRFIVMLATTAMAINVSAQKTITLSKEESGADEIITNYWNNSTAPHSNEETKDEEINARKHFTHTSQTDFYIYKADPAKATGQAIVVLPGGGYSKVCIAHEGFEIAKYFRSLGITAVIVKYRLPNRGHAIVPLEDAQEALRYVRKKAKKWGVDPAQVGICGSSAGGHLAAYTSTFTPDAEKPAFSILFYPVITGTTWETHQNTFEYLLGKHRTHKQQEYYSLENRVTETTPPTILLLSDDDLTVPTISSVLYYEALRANGVSATMHIYPSGGHGWCGHEEFKYDKEYKAALKDWLEIQNKAAKQEKTK